MSEFYADLADTASELIAEFGAQVLLTKVTTGAYDPATGIVSKSEASFTGFGAAFDYAEADIDGTKIKSGDQRVYLSVAGIPEPASDDTLTIGGKLFTVIKSRPVSPAGVAVLHDVQVRGLA